MGILSKLLGVDIRAGPGPADDFWYQPTGTRSITGLRISTDTAMTISTVFRCVSAVAQDVAAMPLIMYRRMGRGKERATNHPLYDVLHDRPNQWQTSFEWRETIMGHLLLRGNAYCLILPGERGFVDQLVPLDPDRMQVEQLSNWRLRYVYTWEVGRKQSFSQDEIFHIRGLSKDGIVGLSVIALARDSMGLSLATEQYGARFFEQNATPGGVLEVEGRLSPEAAQRLKEDWQSAHSGLGAAHKTAVIQNGTKWHQMSISNEDAQFLMTRSFQVEEVARWFGVPLHRIGHTEKATSWGTGIEQFNLGYVAFTLLPWLRRWEQAILRDLIIAPQTFFAEFLVDALLRGDTASRYAAYQTAIQSGWLSRNEARERENLNPREGLDDLLVPQNMATVDEAGDMHQVNQPGGGGFPAVTEPPPEQAIIENGHDTRAMLLATQLALGIIRHEVQTVSKAARRLSGDAEGFHAWLTGFYASHAETVATTLHVSRETAREYAGSQCGAIETHGIRAMETWERDRVPTLAALTLGTPMLERS